VAALPAGSAMLIAPGAASIMFRWGSVDPKLGSAWKHSAFWALFGILVSLPPGTRGTGEREGDLSLSPAARSPRCSSPGAHTATPSIAGRRDGRATTQSRRRGFPIGLPVNHTRAMYRAIYHGRPLLNRYSSYCPPTFPARMEASRRQL
jgi:hypothetical protein